MPSDTDRPHLIDEATLFGALDATIAMIAPGRGLDARQSDEPIDVLDGLLAAAWFNQYQLSMLVSLLGSSSEGAAVVDRVIADAGRLARVDGAAVGAAAKLVALVREGDEIATAQCLARALACFEEAELIAATAGLAAALTRAIAVELEAPATDVLVELIDAVLGRDTGASTVSAAALLDAATCARPVRHARHRRTRTVCVSRRGDESLRIS